MTKYNKHEPCAYFGVYFKTYEYDYRHPRGGSSYHSIIFFFKMIFIKKKIPVSSFKSLSYWQVLPELSCVDTCQIWKGYSIDNEGFFLQKRKNRENSVTEEIGLVTPNTVILRYSA